MLRHGELRFNKPSARQLAAHSDLLQRGEVNGSKVLICEALAKSDTRQERTAE
jgi:hypothetical protein